MAKSTLNFSGDNKGNSFFFLLVELYAQNCVMSEMLAKIYAESSNQDFAKVNFQTWKHNIKAGWEWDTDRFGINFFAHPYSGTISFNMARSNGYNYWQSFPYALGGSLMWEYFGENTLPSYNDVINTPVNGAFLGEILYRISSNILDDRTRGMDRVLREIAAGIIDPGRGINRLLQGKTFRKTNKEIYQKEA